MGLPIQSVVARNRLNKQIKLGCQLLELKIRLTTKEKRVLTGISMKFNWDKDYGRRVFLNIIDQLKAKCDSDLIYAKSQKEKLLALKKYENKLKKLRKRLRTFKMPRKFINPTQVELNEYCLIKKREKERISNKKRRLEDINFKLRGNLRTRLVSALRDYQKGSRKAGSHVKDLGCTVEHLANHLESKFKEGMTWDNYGKNKDEWSIDHIIPLSKFDLRNRNEFLKACNYKNLQPLWSIENASKGNRVCS